jgi:hypothetical protein
MGFFYVLIFFISIFGSVLAIGQPRLSDLGIDQEISDNVQVKLKPDATLYSSADYLQSESLPLLPWNKWKVRCQRSASDSPLQGKLLLVDKNYLKVKLDENRGFCGSSFKNDDADPSIVFIATKDMASLESRNDLQTEAVSPSPACSKNCDSQFAAISAISKNINSSVFEKGNLDIERYLACYPTEFQNDYNKYYKNLIDTAASVFQVAYDPTAKTSQIRAILPSDQKDNEQQNAYIPFLVTAQRNVMKCLGRRESRWNRNAVSATGAVGLGQQVQQNIDNLKCRLKGCNLNGVAIPPTKWVQDLWKLYFSKIKAKYSKEKEKWDWLTNKGHCSETMMTKEDAKCPINAIAAMAVDQILLQMEMRKNLPLHKDSNATDVSVEERLHLQIAAGLSHDAGAGNARKAALQTNDPAKLSRGILSYVTASSSERRVKEVTDYNRYIENCLAQDNWNPMNDGPKKDCSKVSVPASTP